MKLLNCFQIGCFEHSHQLLLIGLADNPAPKPTPLVKPLLLCWDKQSQTVMLWYTENIGH